MELKFKFNEDEVNYDMYRPGYPNELFQNIIAYSNMKNDSKLLEIGIGTGQATLPFLELGCDVTAIEIGDRLSKFVDEKYKDYPKFKVINDNFMNLNINDKSLDMVYSATAFHWLPVEERCRKVFDSLKSGSTVALFWNHPFTCRENDITNIYSKRVYDKYRPSNKKQTEFCLEDCDKYTSELALAGFVNIQCKLYKRVRCLTVDEYIHLLNTYSDHHALPDDIKTKFEKEMRDTLNNIGGKINIYDTIDLYLAQKP